MKDCINLAIVKDSVDIRSAILRILRELTGRDCNLPATTTAWSAQTETQQQKKKDREKPTEVKKKRAANANEKIKTNIAEDLKAKNRNEHCGSGFALKADEKDGEAAAATATATASATTATTEKRKASQICSRCQGTDHSRVTSSKCKFHAEHVVEKEKQKKNNEGHNENDSVGEVARSERDTTEKDA